MSNIEDVPPVPKIEPFEEESFSESSPEPEEQSLTQEPAQVQKRKGGRKPVQDHRCLHSCHSTDNLPRFMQPQRNANKEIVKHRQHLGKGALNI